MMQSNTMAYGYKESEIASSTFEKIPNPQKQSLAMAYVPWQTFKNVVDGYDGLRHGSIFLDLVLPFEGKKAACSYCGCEKKKKNFDGREFQ